MMEGYALIPIEKRGGRINHQKMCVPCVLRLMEAFVGIETNKQKCEMFAIRVTKMSKQMLFSYHQMGVRHVKKRNQCSGLSVKKQMEHYA